MKILKTKKKDYNFNPKSPKAQMKKLKLKNQTLTLNPNF
jgi:hypothetical protein